MIKLDLGCGPNKKKDYIGVDKIQLPGVDIVHDLNHYPYPFADNSVDEIYASHIVEHIDNVVKTMEELWRICKPGATIIIKSPYYKSDVAFSDPTLRHFLTEHTFDVFFVDHPLASFYSTARFKLEYVKLYPNKKYKMVPFKKFFNNFFWNIFETIEFKLKVVKHDIPLGDWRGYGERDDMNKPFISDPYEAYKHIQRYKFAKKNIAGKKVLDLGCGLGYGTKILYDAGFEVVGIDNSFEAIEYAKKNYEGPQYLHGDATNLPFDNETFDAIIAYELIEHLAKPTLFLEEVFRVLKKRGDFFVSSPNPKHLARVIKNKIFKIPYSDKVGPNPYHIKEFSYDELVSLLKKYKFSIYYQFGQHLSIIPPIIMKYIKYRRLFFKIPLYLGYYLPKYSSTVVIWAKK